MSCFTTAIEKLSLSSDHQGELAGLHAALQLSDGDGEDVLSNPLRECIRRWRVTGVNPHFVRRAEELLNDVAVRIDAGQVL